MASSTSTAEREQWEAQLSDVLGRLELPPDDAEGNRTAGRLLTALGRFAEALPHLRRALKAEPQNAEMWYRLGMSAAALDDTETLREALSQFTLIAPQDAIHLTRRAVMHARAREFHTAIEYTDQALSVDAEPAVHAWAHQLRARCYGEFGELRSQLLELERASALGPASPKDIAEMAHLQCRLGQPVTVMPMAEALVAAEPENAEAWYALGAAANRMEDWRRAKEALERAEELGYDFTAGLNRELGTTLGRLGRHQDGIDVLQQALAEKQSLESQAWIHDNLGFFHSRLRKLEQALAHYQEAVRLDPANAHAQQGLGAVYFELRDTASALRHLEQAAQLAPDQENPWYAFGSALAWAGELARAEEALRRSITLGRADGRARARLARVYQQQGNWRMAADEARHALRQGLPKKWRAWVADIANQGGGRRR